MSFIHKAPSPKATVNMAKPERPPQKSGVLSRGGSEVFWNLADLKMKLARWTCYSQMIVCNFVNLSITEAERLSDDGININIS